MRTYSIILTAALLSASATQAQIVNDGATNTLSNVTNTFTGDVTVGTNGSFTLVVLSDNSLLTNSGSGIIGLNATARSNEVRLISPSARWRMGGLLFLGSSGSFNQLVVSNGASVSDGGAIISYLAGTSNRALITGSGSTWSNAGPLYHGFTDPGNQLVVSNGGVVFNDVQAFIGVGSSNNLAVVTGSGSTWTTASDLGVGLGSVGNQLMISNGGAVKNGHGYVGVNPAASNNLALITGAGSVWSNALDLEVGSSEGNNQMIVSSGATVFTASNGLIGSFTNANGNSVTLTDPGTRWWVGNNLYVGSNGALSSLIVSNGAFVHDSSATLGNLAASSNNISLVTGGGSTWSNANNLDIGGFGRGNQLIVSNGGWVAVNRDARLGVNVSSSNNLALVTGVGSVWSNGIGLRVGNIAPGNRLVIEAGGLVIDDTGTVGDFNSASNNEALVTGPGSLWTNHSFLTIGNQIGRNQLIVSNGATVWSGTGSVGSSSNQVVVTGVGSVWSNQTFLLVGGAGDRVDVSDGGWLECNDGYVGQGFSANSNTVALSGVGSGWNNLAGLVVGDGGSGNVLIASNGATVLSSNATIGASTSLGNNNFALLTGAGTMWSNWNDFTVGNFSFGNRLVVSNQATVATSNLFVGFQSASASNRVTADGGTLRANLLDVRHGAATVNAGLMDVDFLRLTNTQGQFEFNGGTLISRGALITSSGLFTVGNSGTNPALWDVRAGASNHFVANHVIVGSNSSFNQVLIGNGAVLTNNGNGIFGFNSGANSNAATVAGAGSQWRPAGDFFVGSAGSFNRLVVSNAGWVVNGTGFMGNSAGANNNEVQVTGPGATWSNRTDVVVGFSGSGNRLTVGNSGTAIAAANGVLGANAGANANTAAVSDPGSSWLIGGTLFVGNNGANASLVVSDGAFVNSFNGEIGHSSASSNNLAIVSGSGSAWTNAVDLAVGSSGSGNQLLVSNGGVVVNIDGVIGASGSNNVARVTGAGSIWAVDGSFELGAIGSFNTLLISNGGTLTTSNAAISEFSGTSNNNAFVVGPASVWINQKELYVGLRGKGNQLIVSNAGSVFMGNAIVGNSTGANSNTVVVTDPGSSCVCHFFSFGDAGAFNRLVVSNGALVTAMNAGGLGAFETSSNNEALISGPGSFMQVKDQFFVGYYGSSNRLVVSNGGWLRTGGCQIGLDSVSSNNEVLVTGPGTIWTNVFDLQIGDLGQGNRMVVSNGAVVFDTAADFVLGFDIGSSNNLLVVDGGTLVATNTPDLGLDVRRGTAILNAGLIDVARLLLTNTQGFFQFNGGTISVGNSIVTNGQFFRIGNGISPANFNLAGNGFHDLSGVLAVSVSSNAALRGNGTLKGGLVVLSGGTLSPGASIGKIVLSNSPSLQGTVIMEISKNGSALTNDQVQVTGTLTYGGALIVTNLGPGTLAAGDRFPLFSATSYAGSFTSLTLPPLTGGLTWKNNLLVDGSLEVSPPPAIAMSSGSYTQNFDSLSMSGAVNLWRDNSTLLGWYAAKSIAPTTITNYRASDGSDTSDVLYSFGSSGSPDRALGSLPSNTAGDVGYGLCFTNDTPNSITNFMITYTGEQWRNGGSGGGGGANTLTFWYQVSSSILINPEPDSVTNWTQVTNLNFVSPTVLASATALNGNDSTNRQIFSSVLIPGLVVIPGQNVFFRWRDINDTGADQGMAVDDLIIAFGPLRPQITSVSLNPTNGFFQLTCLGESNLTYGIEAASNLNSPIFWQRIGSNTADGAGLFQFTDTNAPFLAKRFYRALSP